MAEISLSPCAKFQPCLLTVINILGQEILPEWGLVKFVQAVAYHSCLNIIATTCKYVSFTGPVICLGISCLISNEWSKDYRVWNEEWSDGVLLNLQTFQQFHVSFLELICKSQSLHPRLGATCVRSLVFSQWVTQCVSPWTENHRRDKKSYVFA